MNAMKLIFAGLALAGQSYGQGVFAERFSLLGLPDPPQPVYIGTIPGIAGMYIHITDLGIGGEPDAFSGPTIFSVSGPGLDVSWGAGQRDFSATYALTPTQPVSGPPGGRGFSYQAVSLYGQQGGSLDVLFLFSEDADGLFTYATDALGTFFDDSAYPSSSRVWLRYEYTLVPEPSTWILLGLGGLLWLGRRYPGKMMAS